DAVEPIGDARARRTARGVVGAEHEVIDEELRPSAEQVRQRRASGVGLELIVLVDADPGQRLPLPRELVATAGQFLFGLQQVESSRQPFLSSAGVYGRCHCQFSYV